MRILIVEDELVSRLLLQKILKGYGACDIAVDGQEALEAFKLAHDAGSPYDVIFLDIMMPALDGRDALKRLRAMEDEMGVGGLQRAKVIMTTCLNDADNIIGSFFESGCEAYVTKPFGKEKLLGELRKLGLIEDER